MPDKPWTPEREAAALARCEQFREDCCTTMGAFAMGMRNTKFASYSLAQFPDAIREMRRLREERDGLRLANEELEHMND